jgi:hypothetical protein
MRLSRLKEDEWRECGWVEGMRLGIRKILLVFDNSEEEE